MRLSTPNRWLLAATIAAATSLGSCVPTPTGAVRLVDGNAVEFPATVQSSAFAQGDTAGYHLVVWRGGRATDHALFTEQSTVTERRLGFGRGRTKRLLQTVGSFDHANAATTTTGRGFDHERVADLVRGSTQIIDVGEHASVPRRDRDPRSLGELFGGDLVADEQRAIPDEDGLVLKPFPGTDALHVLTGEDRVDPGEGQRP